MDNKLIQWSDEVFERYIKYYPDSSSIKPVHIANGIFRLILQETYGIETINKWVTRWRRGEEAHPASDIRASFSNLFDTNSFSDDEINDLRYYLNLIFNADNAATPSSNNSVLTISSKSFVRKGVQWEADIHKFIYRILISKVDGVSSSCIEMVNKCLRDESDDLSRLANPLTREAKRVIQAESEEPIELSPVELRIRKAFDIFSANESNESHSKLLTLERFVLLACLSVVFHLTSKALDLSSEYKEQDRVPMILDADGSLGAIKFASEESLTIAQRMIETYFEECLRTILLSEYAENISHEQILGEINLIRIADSKKTKKKTPEDEKRSKYKELYLGFYEQLKNPFNAFVKATRFRILSDELDTDPTSFLINFGGRIALLAPRAQGGRRKRYSPDPLILEVLLLATLKAGEHISIAEFGDKLWMNFGIIIGANPEEDINRLTRWNINQITPGDLTGELSKNAEKIANAYISMGYGKRYADGVTTIYLRR